MTVASILNNLQRHARRAVRGANIALFRHTKLQDSTTVSALLKFAAPFEVKHIVVLRHSGCGGILACLEQSATRQSEARFISNWMNILDEARTRILASAAGRSAAELRVELEREGIKVSIQNLRSFPCIKALESKGRLHLHGAHFEIATGNLSVLNEGTGDHLDLGKQVSG